jgi:hypothetical protein
MRERPDIDGVELVTTGGVVFLGREDIADLTRYLAQRTAVETPPPAYAPSADDADADACAIARHAAGIPCGFLLVCATLLGWVAAFQAHVALGFAAAAVACPAVFVGVYMACSCWFKLRDVFRGLP